MLALGRSPRCLGRCSVITAIQHAPAVLPRSVVQEGPKFPARFQRCRTARARARTQCASADSATRRTRTWRRGRWQIYLSDGAAVSSLVVHNGPRRRTEEDLLPLHRRTDRPIVSERSELCPRAGRRQAPGTASGTHRLEHADRETALVPDPALLEEAHPLGHPTRVRARADDSPPAAGLCRRGRARRHGRRHGDGRGRRRGALLGGHERGHRETNAST